MKDVFCPSCNGSGEKWFEVGAVDSLGPYTKDATYECDNCCGSGFVDLLDTAEFNSIFGKIKNEMTVMSDTLDDVADAETREEYRVRVTKLRMFASSVLFNTNRLESYF